MARKDRFDGALEPFASEAIGTERTVFGDTLQSDDIDDQLTAEFLRGWGIVGVNDLPTKQDFNAIAYTFGYLLSYLYQVGVPEWNATQDYHQYQITNFDGVLYTSLQDDNVGQQPDSEPAYWEITGGAAGDMFKADNLSGLASYPTARANLGIFKAAGTPIASAATTDIGAADSDFVTVTGTETITSLGATTDRNQVWVKFTGAATLTHNAVSLILPGGKDIAVQAGDVFKFIRIAGANWQCVAYLPVSGVPVMPYGTTAGGTTAYTLTTAPAFAALKAGLIFVATMNATNTDAVTIDPNGIGATAVKDAAGNALSAAALVSGRTYVFLYTGAELRVIAGSQGGGFSNYLHIRDEKSSGTNGGTLTQNTDTTRVLNTVVTNEIAGASLSSNQITLPAGTYYIIGRVPTQGCGQHKSWLYNVTDTAVVIDGTSEGSTNTEEATSHSFILGRFTLADTKALSIVTRANNGENIVGLGEALGYAGHAEIYTNIEIWKVG